MLCNFFGRKIHFFAAAPLDNSAEAAHKMVQKKFLRYCLVKITHMKREKLSEIVFDIAHKKLCAFAGKQPHNILFVILQMPQDMGELFLQRHCLAGIVTQLTLENMLENFTAHRLEQCILGFKMRVKGTPAHICPVNDILHRNAVVAAVL